MKLFLVCLAAALICFLSACVRKEPLPEKRIYPSAFEAQRVLFSEGYSVMKVLGTRSMEPLIPAHPKGREVIVAYVGLDQTSFENLKPGMVVAYRATETENYVHRLGQKTSRGFIVYGINNRESDPYFVTQSNFIGRVAKVNLYPLD